MADEIKTKEVKIKIDTSYLEKFIKKTKEGNSQLESLKKNQAEWSKLLHAATVALESRFDTASVSIKEFNKYMNASKKEAKELGKEYEVFHSIFNAKTQTEAKSFFDSIKLGARQTSAEIKKLNKELAQSQSAISKLQRQIVSNAVSMSNKIAPFRELLMRQAWTRQNGNFGALLERESAINSKLFRDKLLRSAPASVYGGIGMARAEELAIASRLQRQYERSRNVSDYVAYSNFFQPRGRASVLNSLYGFSERNKTNRLATAFGSGSSLRQAKLEAEAERQFKANRDSIARKSFWGMSEQVMSGAYGSNWKKVLSGISNTGVLNDMLKNEGRRQLIIQGTGLAYRLGGTGAGLGGQVGAALGGTKGLMWGAGVGGLASAIQSATAQYVKYEDALAKTQAISGATSGVMRDLANSIFKVGSNSRYTNEELIETSTVLAQAGYTGKEISSLLEDVSRLSSATGVDLKGSVDLLTSSMSLWNSETTEAGKMVDALTVAVNSSKAEISSIQKGMQYAGAAASQLGMSFEETVAAMASVTNAGLKTRSIMGTGLRALLTELTTPTKKLETELRRIGLTMEDVNVRSKGFTTVMENLTKAGFGAENAFRALDRQAASFYLAEKSQLNLYKSMTEAMEVRGAAAAAEEKRMDTVVAQWTRLKNTMNDLLFQSGSPFAGALQGLLDSLATAAEKLNSALRGLKDLINTKKPEDLAQEAKMEQQSKTQSIGRLAEDVASISANERVKRGDKKETLRVSRGLKQKYGENAAGYTGVETYDELLKQLSGIYENLSGGVSGASKQEIENQKKVLQESIGKLISRVNVSSASMQSFLFKEIFGSGDVTSSMMNMSLEDLQKRYETYRLRRSTKDKINPNDDFLSRLLENVILNRSELDRAQASAPNTGYETETVVVNLEDQSFISGSQGRVRSILDDSSLSSAEKLTKLISERGDLSSRLAKISSENIDEQFKTNASEKTSEAMNNVTNSMIKVIEDQLKEALEQMKNTRGDSKASIRKNWEEVLTSQIEALSGQGGVLESLYDQIKTSDAINDEELKEKLKNSIVRILDLRTKLVDTLLKNEVQKIMNEIDPESVRRERKMSRAKSDANLVWSTPMEKLNERLKRSGEDFATYDALVKKFESAGGNFEEWRKEKQYKNLSDEEWKKVVGGLSEERDKAILNRLAASKEYRQTKLEKELFALQESQQKNTIRQSRYSSDLSLQLALRNYAAYGADPRLSAVNGIYAAQQRERELRANRETLDENYRLLTKSTKYNKIYSDAERQAADAEYRNSVNENSKALLENTQALKEAQEQYDRQHESWASAGQAVEDFYQSINRNSASYELTLTALNSVSDGLKTTFKDIAINGAKASEAFREMARSILQSLAGKAIDKGVDYLMEAAGVGLKMLGSAPISGGPKSGFYNVTGTGNVSGGNVIVTNASYTGSTGGFVSYNGIKKFAVGGTAGKDSVPALLMPGEYVMKKSAVDMLGKDTLDALNNANTKMHNEDKTSGRIQSKSSKPVVTNVYVVSDPKEAGMTPNDVVVAIGRDILQGGQTRQLIQQVVQGAY